VPDVKVMEVDRSDSDFEMLEVASEGCVFMVHLFTSLLALRNLRVFPMLLVLSQGRS
jgi:hypothetical protein